MLFALAGSCNWGLGGMLRNFCIIGAFSPLTELKFCCNIPDSAVSALIVRGNHFLMGWLISLLPLQIIIPLFWIKCLWLQFCSHVVPIYHCTHWLLFWGHVTDGTPHHPTFPQASNVIGSGQNHVSHTYSFIHKRASLAALDGPTFSQSSSLKKIPRLLPMMPFQHVAVPQDEKPQLYHWLGFALLAGFFSSPFFFLF